MPGTGRDTDFHNSGHLRLELVSIILFIAKLALGCEKDLGQVHVPGKWEGGYGLSHLWVGSQEHGQVS